jgi:hypothetical protein
MKVGDRVWFRAPNEHWTLFAREVGELRWARVGRFSPRRDPGAGTYTTWVKMVWDPPVWVDNPHFDPHPGKNRRPQSQQYSVTLHYAPVEDLFVHSEDEAAV